MELRLTAQRDPSVSDRINGLGFILLLVFVAIAPFPWGGIMPGGTFMIEAFAFAVGAIAFASRADRDRLGMAAVPVVSLILIVALGIVQLIPFSSTALRTLSPQSATIYRDANELLVLHGHATATPRISVAPVETQRSVLQTLAYATLLSSGAVLARTRLRRRWLAGVLLLTSGAHVLVSMARTGTERMHGAYVNANNFAGYLEIALAFAFGAICSDILTARERGVNIRDRSKRIEARLLSLASRIGIWILIAAGIALSQSRGGVLASGITLIVLIAGMVTRKHRRRLALIAAAALVVAVLALTAGRDVLLRFVQAESHDVNGGIRLMIWRSSIKAWKLFPNFGDGLGAFKEAFRRVQPVDLPELIEHAHNDFLQLLVTGGWIGGLLGAVAFISLLVLLYRGWTDQRHREESAFVLAAFGALLSLTLHGLVEFNMSLPATAATLAVMTGAGIAAARHRST